MSNPKLDKGVIFMSNYKLATKSMFEGNPCDVYISDNKESIVMTSRQLGECLGYSDPKVAIVKILSRNPYIASEECSTVTKLVTVDGKCRETRVFNEDGIMEITLLAKTEMAKRFRKFARELIKSVRNGELNTIVTITLEIAERLLCC